MTLPVGTPGVTGLREVQGRSTLPRRHSLTEPDDELAEHLEPDEAGAVLSDRTH